MPQLSSLSNPKRIIRNRLNKERESASERVHQDIGTVESPGIKPNHPATLPKKLIKPFPAETESEGDQRRLPDDRVQVQDQLD